MKTKGEKHLHNKETVRKMKENDKERASAEEKYCVAIYDLQQVLQCPKIEVGQAYYKSKLSVYNLTIYDAGQKQGYCYMWHKCIAFRVSSEIKSCVLSFIEQKADRSYKELILYSDNSMNYNIRITHNFMEVGHTQNEGDSMHSTIKRCDKHVSIYVPSQWYVVARTACKKKPYHVKEMNQNDFYDLKDLVANTTKHMGKDRLVFLFGL
ncbi:hypothetical protein ILUMI_19421 [Ignelater luminosus]|uniref:Uncharacterized protein n=1 Tax=Ignelater luminosus TaxID=2038154 RepID=A0A8K0FZY0_IGNLU|nr:hypothetical protein ILUMI_19421 [Ignelater luminosus]